MARAAALLLLLGAWSCSCAGAGASSQLQPEQQLSDPGAAAAPSERGLASKQETIVPGQAFHDWRDALIASEYSDSDSPAEQQQQQQQQQPLSGVVVAAAASAAGGHPGLFIPHQEARQQLPAQQAPLQQQGSQRQQRRRWVRIVGRRETLDSLDGPPAANTSHPAALRRLAAAHARRAEAARLQRLRAEAAAVVEQMAAAAPRQRQAGEPAEPRLQLLDRRRALLQGTGGGGGGGGASVDELPTLLSAAQLESHLMSFVQRTPGNGGHLQVAGQPWVMAGFDVPQAISLAVTAAGRRQLLWLMGRARRLGLNTMRLWAFADGAPGVGSAGARQRAPGLLPGRELQLLQHSWWWGGGSAGSSGSTDELVVLQPVPGVLNATVLSEGLDWLVDAAAQTGLRLVMVLTNTGSAVGGGAKQLTDWVDPGLTLTDYYTNDTVKSVFLDYAAALVSHTSSISGLPLRHDPVIAGWQLADGLAHPGYPASEPLLAWLRQVGTFLRTKAPHQLLLAGFDGFFGPSSPHHLANNPPAQVFDAASRSPHAYSAACQGADFWLHHHLSELDLAVASLNPDAWLACDPACKLAWARGWLRAHLREALRLQKPLLLVGVGSLRPHASRAALLRLVREEVADALGHRHPMAGVLLAGLSHPDMPDTHGMAVYSSADAVHAPRPTLMASGLQALYDAAWRRWSGHDDLLACLAEAARGPSNDLGEATNTAGWVDGWQDVVGEVAGIGRLAGGGGGRASQE